MLLIQRNFIDKVAMLSLHFEKGDLMVFEIYPQVLHTLDELQVLVDDDGHSAEKMGFLIQDAGDQKELSRDVHKAGHRRRKIQNREHVHLT